MSVSDHQKKEFSFKDYFVPLTNLKAIHFIILIGLIVYFNSLFNGFVGDDWGQIVDNSLVHSTKNIFSFFTLSTFYVPGAGVFGVYYKPLLMTLYSLIYFFAGQSAFLYHLVQLLLHITNTSLLFIFLNTFFKKSLAFILALLFLVHPINSEAVLYIADMQESLFFLFGISALLVFQRSKYKYALVIVGVLELLSLLSKETGILFIIIIIIYSYFFKKNKYIYLTSGVVFSIYLVMRLSTVGFAVQNHEVYLFANSTFIERLYSLPKILNYYLTLFFFPKDLAIAQHWFVAAPTVKNFFIPLVMIGITIMGIILFCIKTKNDRNKKLSLFFSIWLFVGLVSHSQFIVLDATVAERWFYFTIIGVLGVLGIIATSYWDFFIKKTTARSIALVVICLLLIVLSYRSFIRSFDFRNDYALCSHDAAVNKNSYVIHMCLGNEYRKLKQYDAAIKHLTTSITLFPNYYTAMYYLGVTYDEKRDRTNAIKYLRMTLEHNSWGYGADRLAILLIYNNDFNQAKTIAEENLKKQPNNAQLWYALAIAQYMTNEKKAAIESAQKAYTLAPNSTTEDILTGFKKNLPLKFDAK